MEEQDREVLEQFKPRVVYDSNEAFFADSPAEMTDNPGNCLLGAGREPMARAGSGLSLEFLGSYENPDSSHRLSITGRDYRTQYVRLWRERRELRDRVYGRVCPGHEPGTKWLQYWFFYFYDDPSLAARIGFHEGDWEMIQLLKHDGEDHPRLAVYAQHKTASAYDWDELDTDGNTPLVYSALGSHASYPKPGLYETDWFDVADGRGRTVAMTLEVIDENGPGWASWPGYWGDSRPGEGRGGWLTKLPIISKLKAAQSTSPSAPCQHGQWTNPDGWAEKVIRRDQKNTRPAVPVTLEPLGSRLRVSYRLAEERKDEPGWLLVTVDSRGQPPRSFTIDVRGKRSGKWTVPWLELEPGVEYGVHTKLLGLDRVVTESCDQKLLQEKQGWYKAAKGSVLHLFARMLQRTGVLRTRLPPEVVARRG